MAPARAALVIAGLVLAGVPAATAAFPGANGKIVFDRDHDPTHRQLFAMNADGSGQIQLTNDPAPSYFASGSPDGRKIAFTRCAADCEIYVMNADGSDQQDVTNNSATDVRPAWSPDGKKIAFGSLGRGGSWEVVVMNADGSDQRDISNDPAIDWEPAWSPDGTKIAFSRITQGDPNTFQVIVVNADGSGQKSLTLPPDNGMSPDWSPDGTKIAYVSGVPFPPDSNLQGAQADVFVMNADGSAKIDLTNTMSVLEDSPVWSPDGTKIVYVAQPAQLGSNKDLFVMNADGSGQTNLTNSPSFEDGPDWMPVAAPPPPPPPPPPPAACFVPRVVGLRLAPARQRISRAGCTVGRIRKKHSKRIGRVLAQSPRAGTKLVHGGRVNLVVGRR
jgi:tol-pal system beta propeller repeat protein TolB